MDRKKSIGMKNRCIPLHFQNFCVASRRQFVLCPWMGHWEVIWFINDGVRFALLHPGAVCSNGFPRMERSHRALRCNTGSCWSGHPMQFHSSIAHMPLEPLLDPLICKEALNWDCWNAEADFIRVAIVRSQVRHKKETLTNLCKIQVHNSKF